MEFCALLLARSVMVTFTLGSQRQNLWQAEGLRTLNNVLYSYLRWV